MKKTTISLVAILLVIGSIPVILKLSGLKSGFQEIEIYNVLSYSSKRKPIEDVVLVSSSSPLLSLVGTPIAAGTISMEAAEHCYASIAGALIGEDPAEGYVAKVKVHYGIRDFNTYLGTDLIQGRFDLKIV
ncbi:MAG: hypothetical protein DRN40_00950 [Thermoplasmata archaeon]|nr:MAG: hypothetical protein DRN40_00950 [Thermoplasmata archaeon]